jgi:alkylation response protein AidB-like acyl-CoA dehydrogenase
MDILGPDSLALPASAEPALEVLAQWAEAADRDGVSRSSIDALARAGLLGRSLDPVALQRELAERIAMVCATTWFCWTQHQSPMQALAHSEESPGVSALKERWLAGLESGELLGAVAFAHVRRPGPPNPVAARTDGGWLINGTLDWVTSWDIADVVLVMVRGSGADADSLISFYLPAGRSVAAGQALPAGVQVGELLKLLSMSGTHTRPLTFENVFIPDDLVVSVQTWSDWERADLRKTSYPNPAAFGISRGAIKELHEVGTSRSDDVILNLAEQLRAEAQELRKAAYLAIDDADSATEDLQTLRARSLELAVRAATAVVIARSGAAMITGCSAERRLRESMFLQVQAQTSVSRHAALALLNS